MLPRPRLRTILLVVNLLVLVVPVLGFAALQIYDTQLIQRTESQLISQAAFLKASAEKELVQTIAQRGGDELPDNWGLKGAVDWPDEFYDFRPVAPILDGSRTRVREPEMAPKPPRGSPDPLMAHVGSILEPTILQTQQTTLAGMNIVDWHGNVVATTNESERGMSLHHREEIERALNGEIVHLLRQRESIPEHTSLESLSRETSNRVFFSMPVTYEDHIVGVVTLWRTPMSLPQALYQNRTVFGILLLLMLLAGLTITGLTAFYIGRPIQRLIDQTDRAARHEADGTEPIKKPGTYEIQRLSESIAQMATSLEERADYIRTFARSVSHEFKTPLTSIRGTVELLEDHFEEMSDEERANFLQILDADAERLEQLVRRLLELAKADMASPEDAHCDVHRVTEAIAGAHRTKNFDIELDLPDPLPALAISEEALKAAITNLVVNAREHGDTQATITAHQADDNTVTLRFIDDGPGISDANRHRIFDEFFTTARARGGTGLGLSITRALLQAHDGTIRYIPTDVGACFEIDLPAHGVTIPTEA